MCVNLFVRQRTGSSGVLVFSEVQLLKSRPEKLNLSLRKFIMGLRKWPILQQYIFRGKKTVLHSLR